eukprot:3937305-Rhodomonas_salina.2
MLSVYVGIGGNADHVGDSKLCILVVLSVMMDADRCSALHLARAAPRTLLQNQGQARPPLANSIRSVGTNLLKKRDLDQREPTDAPPGHQVASARARMVSQLHGELHALPLLTVGQARF